MIIVQMCMDDNINVFGCKPVFLQTLLKGIYFPVNGLFPLLRLDGIHFAGVYQDIFVPALDYPAENGNCIGFTLTVLIGHHAFVKYFCPNGNGVDRIDHCIP